MKHNITENDVNELASWVTSVGKQILEGTIDKEPNGKKLLEAFQRMLNILYGR